MDTPDLQHSMPALFYWVEGEREGGGRERVEGEKESGGRERMEGERDGEDERERERDFLVHIESNTR